MLHILKRFAIVAIMTIMTINCLTINANNIEGTSADSASGWRALGKFEQTELGRATVVSVPIIAVGLCAKPASYDFKSIRNDYYPHFSHHQDDYIQYAPAALMLVMKACGVRSRTPWGQMLVADAFGVATMAAIVNGLKYTTLVERPNGKNNHSFPSGHTATAFMTATMLHHEYGQRFPWLSAIGYANATFTGLMRMANNMHWLQDVLVGAGIGIFTTELGYFISDAIFKNPHKIYGDDYTEYFKREDRPSFLSLVMAANIPLNSYKYTKDTNLETAHGCNIGIEGALYFKKNFGVGGRCSFSNVKLRNTDSNEIEEAVKNTDALLGAYFSFPVLRRVLLGTKLLAVYNHYSALDLDLGDGKQYRLPRTGGAEGCAGAWINFRIKQTLNYKMFCDYCLTTAHYQDRGDVFQTLRVGAMVEYQFRGKIK